MADGFDLSADKPTPNVFIQWKGTDACFDFRCSCGFEGHFDGYFAYVIRCRGCGRDWEMPSVLCPRTNERFEATPVVPGTEQDLNQTHDPQNPA